MLFGDHTQNTYQAWSGLGEQERLVDIMHIMLVCALVFFKKNVFITALFWFSPVVSGVQLLNLFCSVFFYTWSICVCQWSCGSRRDKNGWYESTAAGDTSPHIWEVHGSEHTDADISSMRKQICTGTLVWTHMDSFFPWMLHLLPFASLFCSLHLASNSPPISKPSSILLRLPSLASHSPERLAKRPIYFLIFTSLVHNWL